MKSSCHRDDKHHSHTSLMSAFYYRLIYHISQSSQPGGIESFMTICIEVFDTIYSKAYLHMRSSNPRRQVALVSFFTMPAKRTLIISSFLVVICLATVHSIASIRGTAISARNSQTRENKIAAGFLKLRAGLPQVD